VISALIKSFSQFGDPRIRRVVWLSVGLAVAILVALAVALWFLIGWAAGLTGWLDTLAEFAAGFGVVILAWLLFPAAIGLTVGLFLEDVADAVEARHYPGLPAVRAQSVREAIGAGLKFAAVALALNLIALPFYLLLIWVPFLSPILFYSLNGYLLGREYFEAVALRRLDDRQARLLRRARGGQVFLAGVIIAFLLTVPFVNLVAPVIATGFMLHLFEGMRRQMARPPDEGVGGRGRGLSQK
jgi:uncharacterized protein involved in cysteine biosynthesis